jgi:hypothetical protein
MAGEVSWLYELRDFRALIEEASRQRGIANPAVVEKDYYVTEALRRIAEGFGDAVIFKGGTSLSKGWGIINRFSEDIDLYVEPLTTESGTAERFSDAAETVLAFPGFSGRGGRSDKGSVSWTEEFSYTSRLEDLRAIRPVVLLEAGIQSADQPTETVFLKSILSSVLDDRGVPADSNDRAPFPMRLLHFRRTFVEKLFTLHTRVERAIRQSRPLGRDARHYYDLAMLLEQEETLAMLASDEYEGICGQYRELTQQFFPGQVKFLPVGMNLEESPALFPGDEMRQMLEAAYVQEAESLCYGDYPSFDEVLNRFLRVRDRLRVNLA